MLKPSLWYCSMPCGRSGTQIITWSIRVNIAVSFSLSLALFSDDPPELPLPLVRVHAADPRLIVEAQAGRDAGLLRLVERGFGLNHRDRRGRGDALGECHGLRHDLVVRHDLVHHSERCRFLRVPAPPGENEFLRLLDADEPRQPLARSASRGASVRPLR